MACMNITGPHMTWVKSMLPEPMRFTRHNYVFPRGIGLCDWLLLPEVKQVIIIDHLHEDIR